MSITFLIPGPLRQFTDGNSRVTVTGSFSSLADALAALFAAHPGCRDRMLTDQGEIREHVNVFVGDECVRFAKGLATPIRDAAEISIVPAITGGATGPLAADNR